ncbi:MAG: FecR domain-containing protein [Pseudomonadota bacterium]
MTRGTSEQSDAQIRAAAFEWRALFDAELVTAAQRREFEQWLAHDPAHAKAYEYASQAWHEFGQLRREDLSPALRLATPGASGPASPDLAEGAARRSRRHLPVIAWATAAAAVVAVGLATIPFSQRNDALAPRASAPVVERYESPRGHARTIVLPDESELTLASATQIEAVLRPDAREVRLISGAAVFDVAPDAARPFTVKAGALEARAVGTVFEVRNNGGVYRVAVREGQVEARFPYILNEQPTSLARQASLGPGEHVAATAAAGLGAVEPFPPHHFAAWELGRLVYVGATLAEIVADANRYSPTPITLAPEVTRLPSSRVTVSFAADDVEQMLSTLMDIFPVALTDSPDGRVFIPQ